MVHYEQRKSPQRYLETMNNNLVPEVRRDKNGNAVTRWIRSLSKNRTPTTLPSPALQQAPRTTRNEQAAMELFGVLMPMTQYKPDWSNARNMCVIAEHDLELLNTITRVSRNNVVDADYWADRLDADRLATMKPDDLQLELNKYRVALTANTTIHDIAEATNQSMSRSALHMNNTTVQLLIENGNLHHPDNNLIKALTVISYIKGIQDADAWKPASEGTTVYEGISSDAHYIAEHYEEVMELLPELRSRKTHDKNTIEAMINNDTKVLREGEL